MLSTVRVENINWPSRHKSSKVDDFKCQPFVRANDKCLCNLKILYTLTSVCIFSVLFSIYFQGADKENLFINLGFILVSLMHDSGATL